VRPQGLRISAISALVAIAGVGGIAANRHSNGNTEWMNLAWTGVFALGALGLAGIVAQGVFKSLGRVNALANLAFIVTMTLASGACVLYKGPARNFAMAKLSTYWPAGADLLAKTDPSGPAPARTTDSTKPAAGGKTVKGEPQIKVYHKGEQSAHAPE
jgi:hypothetical protein